MAALIDISPAAAQDFPTLARIAARAMAIDLIHRIVYASNDPLDTSRQEHSINAELHRSAANPQAHIFQATWKSSGEIVGYGLFRFDDGDAQVVGGPSSASFPPGTNMELLGRMGTAFRAAHARHMSAKRHVWWTSLMVLPAYQKMGIGTAMLEHGFETLGADEVPIWLVTQMRGRAMYQKFGFEDVDVLDVDYGEYAGPYRGFGVHRSICMVRQPGGVPSSEPKAEMEWEA